jgi:hypothetical protein
MVRRAFFCSIAVHAGRWLSAPLKSSNALTGKVNPEVLQR